MASPVPPTIVPIITGSGRDRVITPYRADVFEAELKRWKLADKYKDLPAKLRHGFPIGDFIPLTSTFTPPNRIHSTEHKTFVRDYLRQEVALGHMTGPHSQSEVQRILGGHFVSSPLIVIDKQGSPGQFRLIQNMSFKNPDGISVNDQIDSDDFPTTWGTAAQVEEVVAGAKPGTQGATIDIESAFRTIPILPAHKPYLVVQGDSGLFYIDHVCPFGVASGTGVLGEVMDAIVDILEGNGIKPSMKWVDDLLQIRAPIREIRQGLWQYGHDLNSIFRITKLLGVPWKPAKCVDYSFQVVYWGLSWDFRARTVSLPDEKRLDCLVKVKDFISAARSGTVSQKDSMSIGGSLENVCFVYREGRAYLPNLYSFIASIPDKSTSLAVPHPVLSDMNWWQITLSNPGGRRSLAPRTPRPDIVIYADASTSWGIGILITTPTRVNKIAYELRDGWEAPGRNIGWAEMIAIELAVRQLKAIVDNLNSVSLVIRCDNQGVIGAFNRGRSRNIAVNLSIRRTNLLLLGMNSRLTLEYVNTAENLADPLSRGELPPGPWLDVGAPGLALPSELWKFVGTCFKW